MRGIDGRGHAIGTRRHRRPRPADFATGAVCGLHLALSEAHAVLDGLPIDVRSFDRDDAFAIDELRGVTRVAGLFLGDKACLALAMRVDRGNRGSRIDIRARANR
jgi:hypothetical protein